MGWCRQKVSHARAANNFHRTPERRKLTQIAYVADNPGYHSHATTAPPLVHVFAHAGPACAAAALSVPTPVPTPKASATTASPSTPASYTSADGTYRGTTSGTYRGTTSGPRFASTR